MTISPRWYSPPGDLPAHARKLHPVGLLPGHGPEVDAARAAKADPPAGGGVCWGGAYIPNEPGWIQAPAGWWYHPGQDTAPDHLVRGTHDPAFLRWEVIAGTEPGQRWMVPVLLVPMPGLAADDPAGPIFVPAVDRVRRNGAWQIKPEIGDLCGEAIQVLYQVANAGATKDTAEDRVLDFVARILGLAYHVSRVELEAHGWLSQALVMRVLTTVVDLEPPDQPTPKT